MAQNRVRIVDVADALGLSTATVSKVIHGKTEKISDETVKRVQQELESSGYIPNMAGILLARNNSRIIGVVVNDNIKYEGRVLEDGFVMSSLNALSHEVNRKGCFLMIKTTSDISEIPVFASMWNMDGLILMGFCEADYEKLRNQMRISFVVYDGYFEKCSKVVNLVINHYDGGYQAGKYFRELGHKKALCIADNFICMDKERIEGFCKAFEPGKTLIWQIPKTEKERIYFYQDNFSELLKNNITAVFAVSDFYALEVMRFLQGKGLHIPEDIQIIGFDVSFICGIIIATMFLLASGVFSSQILSLYTKDTSIISTGEVYFRIVAFSYIPMAISNILSAWLRCNEHAAIPFAASFVAVAVSILLIFLAGIYTRLYRVDYSVKELGKILLIIFALYAPVKVENMILGGGIIRSGGNTKIIMVIDIIGTWCIGISLCLVAAYVFKWGIIGVYTLLTTEEIFRLVMSLIIFRKRKWMISLS